MNGHGPSGEQIRAILLEVVNEYSARGPGQFQSEGILRETADRLGIRRNVEAEQALLTAWGDLFRQGHLAWGHNLSNPGPPFCHVTEMGRRTLQNYSRDPANPDGYLAHLMASATLNPIAESYLREALATYNSNCYKATAVMVGAASESLILGLRDAVVTRLQQHGRNVSQDLEDWRIKRVIDGIHAELLHHRRDIPRDLREAFDAFWPAFVQQIRTARNEAGHPSNVDPVTPETVHGSLLIFHEVARLAEQLTNWVQAHMP